VAAVLVLNTPDDGRLRPKHVEWLCRNKTCILLNQVGVSFDLYYDARKHKIKIYIPALSIYTNEHTSRGSIPYVPAFYLINVSCTEENHLVTRRGHNSAVFCVLYIYFIIHSEICDCSRIKCICWFEWPKLYCMIHSTVQICNAYTTLNVTW